MKFSSKLKSTASFKKYFKTFSSSHSYILRNQSLLGFSSKDLIKLNLLLKFKFEFLQNKYFVYQEIYVVLMLQFPLDLFLHNHQ